MRVLLLPVAFAVACGGAAHPKTPPPPPPDPHADAVRAAIEPLYEREILHGGMVVALIDPAKPAPTYLGFGRTSPDVAAPPDERSLFEIGSVSKVLTSLLLADAVQRGEVTLDEPAAQLVPLGVRFPDADGVRPTLAELASHRAGLPTLPDNLAPADTQDPYADYGTQQLYDYLDHAQLQTVPGTQYAYSNLGAGILGNLLARTIGESYEQAVKTRILAPLGLAETFIAIPKPLAPRFVPGTTAAGDAAKPWSFDALAGAGAWRSDARDLVKLLEEASAAAGGKNGPLADVFRTTFTPQGQAGPGMTIALGWHITDHGVVWHNGMTGGYASFIGFDPSTRTGVVILASTASPLVTKLGIGAFDVFDDKKLDLGLDIVDVAPAALDKLAGTYQVQSGEQLTVRRDAGTLLIEMGPDKVRLYPRSETQFIVLELEATIDFSIQGDQVAGFVLHLPQGDVPAERIK